MRIFPNFFHLYRKLSIFLFNFFLFFIFATSFFLNLVSVIENDFHALFEEFGVPYDSIDGMRHLFPPKYVENPYQAGEANKFYHI